MINKMDTRKLVRLLEDLDAPIYWGIKPTFLIEELAEFLDCDKENIDMLGYPALEDANNRSSHWPNEPCLDIIYFREYTPCNYFVINAKYVGYCYELTTYKLYDVSDREQLYRDDPRFPKRPVIDADLQSYETATDMLKHLWGLIRASEAQYWLAEEMRINEVPIDGIYYYD